MKATLQLADTVPESIVDGPGIRFTIFVQGCPHHCPSCHNPATHDFGGGTEITLDSLLSEIDKRPYITGITLSGGEPFCQAEALSELAFALKAKNKHVMAYSGYTFEELIASKDSFISALLRQLDLLVDGPFILAQRSLELRFRGSANQRVLNVPASLKAGCAILAEQYL